LDGHQAGARVDNDRYEKESGARLCSLKAPKPGSILETEIGAGRPAAQRMFAMAMNICGETLTSHSDDLAFLITKRKLRKAKAQREKRSRVTGCIEHFRRRREDVQVAGIFTLRDLLKRRTTFVVSLALASVPYRGKPINFDGLQQAQARRATAHLRDRLKQEFPGGKQSCNGARTAKAVNDSMQASPTT